MIGIGRNPRALARNSLTSTWPSTGSNIRAVALRENIGASFGASASAVGGADRRLRSEPRTTTARANSAIHRGSSRLRRDVTASLLGRIDRRCGRSHRGLTSAAAPVSTLLDMRVRIADPTGTRAALVTLAAAVTRRTRRMREDAFQGSERESWHLRCGPCSPSGLRPAAAPAPVGAAAAAPIRRCRRASARC